MADCLQVISSALFVTNVRGDGGISGGARQIFTFAEGNMLAFGVLVALGQAEINDINVIFCALVAANEEIIRFYISVNDSLFMHFLNSLDLQSTMRASVI